MFPTLFLAAIILGAVVLFIILFVLVHKKGRNKKLAKQKVVLADTIWKNKLQIDVTETMQNYLLAIDTTNFILVYINFSAAKEEVVLLSLWQIRTVEPATEYNSLYEQRKGKPVLVDNHLSKLQLQVTVVDSFQKVNLPLYEYKDGLQDFVQIRRRADYWCHLINKSIRELPYSSAERSKYA